MAKTCKTCGRSAHVGLCDMAELTDGRTVHVSRIDSPFGDVRRQIEAGQVKVMNRWIKRPVPNKTKARRS